MTDATLADPAANCLSALTTAAGLIDGGPVTDVASPPRVVVVIPCYAQAGFLPEAVASVCAQTCRELEMVIVDDGSPDDTEAVARRLAAAYPNRALQLLRQSNQGLSASRNNGIACSSAEYVLALDADDLIEPTFVEDCLRVLDVRRDVSIAYGRQRYFGDVNAYPPMPEYDLAQLTHRNLFPCTALFRRSAWTDVGGYDEQLTSYEDWDFWLGCGERGHFGLHVPHSVFYYRRRNGSMLADASRRDQQLKAQLVLNHPGLFSREQAGWAAGVLEGDIGALAIDGPLGIIPALGQLAVVACRSGGAFDGARRFATLAMADEILERPQLLAAYGAEIGRDDDATLVICGTEEQLVRLGHLVDDLGLDASGAADLLGVTVDDIASSLLVAATKVDALLTLQPLRLPVPLPRFDEIRVHELRQLTR